MIRVKREDFTKEFMDSVSSKVTAKSGKTYSFFPFWVEKDEEYVTLYSLEKGIPKELRDKIEEHRQRISK